MLTIGITGGTGFIGRHLTHLLITQGHSVIIFTTKKTKDENRQLVNYSHWDPDKGEMDKRVLQQLDGVVHLAGAGIADKRWTRKRKEEILESRLMPTRFLVEQLRAYAPNCKVLVCASAQGIYGPDKVNGGSFTEDSPPYTDFLAQTVKQWEAASLEAQDFLRRVVIRFGIVLGPDGGAFKELVQPMNYGIMPFLGGGNQIYSWIHVDDLSSLILKALTDPTWEGVYNGATQNPVSQKTLMRTIAFFKGKAYIPIHVPAFVLKALFGGVSTEVLKSCTLNADKVRRGGFNFEFPFIESAVRNILLTKGK